MTDDHLTPNQMKQVDRLNRSIEQWTNKCLQNSIKLESINRMLGHHLIDEIRKEKRNRRVKWLSKSFARLLLFNLALFVLLMHSEHVSDLAKTVGRMFLIKVN